MRPSCCWFQLFFSLGVATLLPLQVAADASLHVEPFSADGVDVKEALRRKGEPLSSLVILPYHLCAGRVSPSQPLSNDV